MSGIFLAGVPAKVQTLIGRLTATRAGYLDRLDATITSRASATDYTSARAAKIDNLDAAVSSIATESANYTTDLNLFTAVQDTASAIKTPGGTYWPDDTEFWNWVADFGTYITMSGNSTWNTICNLSGSGRFFAAITTDHDIYSYRHTQLRVTLDGTVYTVAFGDGTTSFTSSRGVFCGGLAGDNTFADTATGTFGDAISNPGGNIELPSPLASNSNGSLVARFHTQLKVEAWANYVPSSTPDKYAGAIYLLDQPTVS